ncbi:Trk system potassium transporter TrkA [Chitinibacter bivalviorum]|uniref:Trk system potassium uptake protein TrkA n=1 Tax=Chitinibacter bivalviorum TaxID=2739434 RepID=A0A7H9BJQ4_9NEIS|nr:Trk system potassium transporter TrkA [Chitinibacter bivalviorum]QLG88602.1 Trk system potassium transporter TrkA [Chitinibacter bivalviorum]
MPNILILGAGRVGTSVAEQLVHENYNVTIVDDNPHNLQPLADKLDLRTLVGHAANPLTLEAAGAADADLLLAVTPSDELNMVACKMAHMLFNVPTRLGRIRDQDLLARSQLFTTDGFAVDHVITPAQIVTDLLARLVATPEALQVLDFGHGRAKMVAVRVEAGAHMDGKDLATLAQYLDKIDCRVVSIYRKNKRIPADGSTTLTVGDEVFFLAASKHVRAVIQELRASERAIKRITICGGGNVGYRLAKTLENDYQIKIIEVDRERAQWLAEHLPKCLILRGEATDENLLDNEQIDRCDLFLALTSDDEDNIMSSLLAKQMGARKVVAIINRSRYVDLLQGGKIDVAISPAQATIGSLLAHVRQGDIVAVHSLRRGEAEAIELIAHGDKNNSRVIGRKVEEIKLPQGANLAAIIRGEHVIMAHHDTVIENEDHVIVFIDNKRHIREIEHLFAVKIGFF